MTTSGVNQRFLNGKDAAERDCDLAACSGVYRERRALVRNVNEINPRDGFQQLPHKVRDGAVATRGVVEFPGARPGQRNQLLHCLDRQRRVLEADFPGASRCCRWMPFRSAMH